MQSCLPDLCCTKRVCTGCEKPQDNNDLLYSQLPENLRIWRGGDFHFSGDGIKYRKIVFFKIQLYSVALYVEEKTTAAELKRLQKEGFFSDYSDDNICKALFEGSFKKLLVIQLRRNVSFSQFTDEIQRDLEPRLQKTGNEDLWLKFKAYFNDKALTSGSNLLALWKEDGGSEGGLYAPDFSDFEHATVGLNFPESAFGDALFDVYAGPGAIVPDARKKWAQALRDLLKQQSGTGLLQ